MPHRNDLKRKEKDINAKWKCHRLDTDWSQTVNRTDWNGIATISAQCFSVFAPLLTVFQHRLKQASFEKLQKCTLECWGTSGPRHKLAQASSSRLCWDPQGGWVRWNPQWWSLHPWLVHFHCAQRTEPSSLLPALLPHWWLNHQKSVDIVKQSG